MLYMFYTVKKNTHPKRMNYSILHDVALAAFLTGYILAICCHV